MSFSTLAPSNVNGVSFCPNYGQPLAKPSRTTVGICIHNEFNLRPRPQGPGIDLHRTIGN